MIRRWWCRRGELGRARWIAGAALLFTVAATIGVACGSDPIPPDRMPYEQVPESWGGEVAAADEEPEGGGGWSDTEPVDVLHGRASYYHDSLAGNTTANGEIYDPERMTAASRDLPFGTIVRVIRKDNDRRVTVRINDRGPFRDHSRILDLSRAAAERLDMIRAGVVDIRAEVLRVP